MRKIILILSIMALTFTASASDLEANKISLFGLMNMNAFETEEFNLGAGANVDFIIDSKYSIETGVMYVDKVVEFGNNRFAEYDAFHFPVLFKVRFDNGVAAGLGPFMETSADDLFEDLEFGLDLALSKDFILSNGSNVFVEGRYSSRITDNDGGDFDQLMLLAGFRFNI